MLGDVGILFYDLSKLNCQVSFSRLLFRHEWGVFGDFRFEVAFFLFELVWFCLKIIVRTKRLFPRGVYYTFKSFQVLICRHRLIQAVFQTLNLLFNLLGLLRLIQRRIQQCIVLFDDGLKLILKKTCLLCVVNAFGLVNHEPELRVFLASFFHLDVGLD